jgi:hypothetical protein
VQHFALDTFDGENGAASSSRQFVNYDRPETVSPRALTKTSRADKSTFGLTLISSSA